MNEGTTLEGTQGDMPVEQASGTRVRKRRGHVIKATAPLSGLAKLTQAALVGAAIGVLVGVVEGLVKLDALFLPPLGVGTLYLGTAGLIATRIRWVPAEAIGGAAALYIATGDQKYADWYERIWDHARDWFIDYEHGSWKQELDENGNVSSTVWSGKADIYHLWHCLVVPRLPLAPGLAPAVAAGLLDIRLNQTLQASESAGR